MTELVAHGLPDVRVVSVTHPELGKVKISVGLVTLAGDKILTPCLPADPAWEIHDLPHHVGLAGAVRPAGRVPVDVDLAWVEDLPSDIVDVTPDQAAI